MLLLVQCLLLFDYVASRKMPRKTAEDCQADCEYKYSEINAACEMGKSVICAGEAIWVITTGGGFCQGASSVCDAAQATNVFVSNKCKQECEDNHQTEFNYTYSKLEEMHGDIKENNKKLSDLRDDISVNYYKDTWDELNSADSHYYLYKRSKTEQTKNDYINVVIGKDRLWPVGWDKLIQMLVKGDRLKKNIYEISSRYCLFEWFNNFSHDLYRAMGHIFKAHFLQETQLENSSIEHLSIGWKNHKDGYFKACRIDDHGQLDECRKDCLIDIKEWINHGKMGTNDDDHCRQQCLLNIRLGQYENHHYENGEKNDWHFVNITEDSGGNYRWMNRAGVSWSLYVTIQDYNLTVRVGEDCPFYANGYRDVIFNAVGVYGPGNEFYQFKGNDDPQYNREAVCEGHNYGQDKCESIDCCEFDEEDGQCYSLPLSRCTPADVDNGEAVCEGHNYEQATCESIGCCEFDGHQCMSSVGRSICTAKDEGTGEAVCEGHNYGQAKCESIGCCGFVEDSGTCLSSVGRSLCTPVDEDIRKRNCDGCIFPFKYNRVLYNKCTNVDYGNAFWCATSLDENGDYYNWKQCEDSCPSYKVQSDKAIDGGWSTWITSSCSAPCGEGKRVRKRTCSNPFPINGGKDCSGNQTNFHDCQIKEC